jgi:hypothetical protein
VFDWFVADSQPSSIAHDYDYQKSLFYLGTDTLKPRIVFHFPWSQTLGNENV